MSLLNPYIAQIIRANAQSKELEGPFPNTKSVPGVETPTGIKYPADGEYANVLMGKGMPDISISGNEVPPKEMAKVDNRMMQIESALKNINSLDLMPDPDSMEGPMAWLYKMRLALNPGMRAEQEARNTQFRMATQMQLTNQYLQLAQFKQQANALSPGEEAVQVGGAGIMVRELEMRAAEDDVNRMEREGRLTPENAEAERARIRGIRTNMQVEYENTQLRVGKVANVMDLAKDPDSPPATSSIFEMWPEKDRAAYAETQAARKANKAEEKRDDAAGKDPLMSFQRAFSLYYGMWEPIRQENMIETIEYETKPDGSPVLDEYGLPVPKEQPKITFRMPEAKLLRLFNEAMSDNATISPHLADIIRPYNATRPNEDDEFLMDIKRRLGMGNSSGDKVTPSGN